MTSEPNIFLSCVKGFPLHRFDRQKSGCKQSVCLPPFFLLRIPASGAHRPKQKKEKEAKTETETEADSISVGRMHQRGEICPVLRLIWAFFTVRV